MKKNKRTQSSELNIGFQIAPMIDVVFVIMLFFMVMAGQVQVEKDLSLKLPSIGSEHPSEMAEEPQIRVLQTGEVFLNDEQIADSGDARLTDLTGAMSRLSETMKASQGKLFATVEAEEDAPYQRVVDVLNALSAARVQNVTFAVTSA